MAAPPAAAQSAQSVEDEVMKPVRQLFDGMRARDTTVMRAALHAEARLLGTSGGPGRPAVRLVPIDRFLASIAAATRSLDERIWDWEVRVDDNLATVWTKYDFLVDGEFSHCGVDAFQLVRTAPGEWKIIQIADTQRRENCWRAP
jgi:hypothetical protein